MTDDELERECPECGAMCLVDDGNYVAISALPATPSDKQEAENNRCPDCFGAGVYAKAAVLPEPPDVTCMRCNGRGVLPGSAAPLAQSAEQDRIDAERWRETLKHISIWLSGGRRMVWSMSEKLPVPGGTDYYKDSEADRFTQAIDAAIAKGVSK